MALPIIKSFLAVSVLALTPRQRWEAAGKFNGDLAAESWFILIAVAVIVILTVLLAVISFNRIWQNRKAAEKLFVEYAQKRGLTAREREILLGIASGAGLKRKESIFTLDSAFDRGIARMKETLESQQTREQASQFRMELAFLREKLGFMEHPFHSKDVTGKSKKLSSRQIPVGKTVHMTRRKRAQDSGDVESSVVKNSDTELAVKLSKRVKITFGEFWCVRYYFGASVWEFDTSVISYDGDILVLNHSDDVRFINRRRFIRVPVKRQAFIAHFPFAKAPEPVLGPPEFVPAVITELAGPGLRIESRLKVKQGERVLVVFNLEERQGGDLTGAKAGVSKIVEDIGEVRHTRAMPNGLSIAVELTGLSDSNVNELIRATNAASVKADVRNSTNQREYMEQPVIAQGA